MAVPQTRTLYLPYSVQHKILCNLQASREQVCFEYIKRKNPKVLEETQNQWKYDGPHALELNQYMYLFMKTDEFGPEPVGLDDDRSMRDLYHSLIMLRHAAVHRKMANVKAVRRWVSDAFGLAVTLGNSRTATQYQILGSYLEAEQNRIETHRKEAEERLLATVKELAAKRAELDRLEREAMNRFREEHKQSSIYGSANLSKIIDASVPLNSGPGVDFEETSSTEPTTSPVEPIISPIEPIISPAEPITSPAEPLSLEREETLSTDPISGVFGGLEPWHNA
jgi:hypothetical protein